MASILFKWFFITFTSLLLPGNTTHPIYVSVTEIEHNAKEKTMEVSCKLFTDDFEKTLRSVYKAPVDLINPVNRAVMDKLVNDYVQQHLKITVDGKQLNLQYLGYELIEEGIFSYYESANVEKPNEVTVFNNLLYENHPQQMGLIHVTVNGNRKSTRLNNPENKVSIRF